MQSGGAGEVIKQPTSLRVRIAWAIAVAADALQLALLPAFAEGGASPFDDVLDVIVACLLTWLLGFHWAFLPAFVAEVVPGMDEFPTWTASVLFVRGISGRAATGWRRVALVGALCLFVLCWLLVWWLWRHH